MRIFLLRRRHLVALLGVVLVLAIFAVVNAPAAVIASASTRQLPIYCVDRATTWYPSALTPPGATRTPSSLSRFWTNTR